LCESSFFDSTGANAVNVAKRGQTFQRSRKQAAAVEEIDQSLCAGMKEAIANSGRDDGAGIE